MTAGGREKNPYTQHQKKKNSFRKKKKEREETGALERKKGISAVNSRSVCLKTFQIVERAEKCISWGRRRWAEGGCVTPAIACAGSGETRSIGQDIPEGGDTEGPGLQPRPERAGCGGKGGQGGANAGQKEARTHPAAWTRREHSLPRERSQARKKGRVLHDSIYRKCPE